MKLTNDRLAVARAVRKETMHAFVWSRAIRTAEEMLESLPEPPDDSPATLPAPDVQAQDDLTTEDGWRYALAHDAKLAAACEYGRRHGVLQAEADAQAQIDAARAEEREACAQLVAAGWRLGVSSEDTASDLACQIRARSGARGV